ncbi:MAG: phospholipase A [Opitutaceae bacterium]|nr:phospholipase A [Opitutaceae bacterium]
MKVPTVSVILAVILCFSGHPGTASGQGASQGVSSLIPQRGAVTPQSPVVVDWVTLNPSAEEIPFDPPREITASLLAGNRSWQVLLAASQQAPVSILPGTFAVRSYTLTLPSGAKGRAILEVPGSKGASALQAVIVIQDDAPPALAQAPAPLTNFAVRKPAASAIERSFAGRLSAHESIYFLYGAEKPSAKFQFSFKYRLLSMGGSGSPNTLQFAYTQRSLWDITSPSSPFYDTSYMPELMFESLAPMPTTATDRFIWLGFQAGYKHESNGRDGPLSRSVNTLNLRTAFVLGRPDGWRVIAVPEIFGYIWDLDNNPDIADFRGYGQLRVVVGKNDGPALMTTCRSGKDFDHFTYQLDLTVPFRTRLLEFESYFLFQYFNGYGESLRTYRVKSDQARFGVSFVR